MIAPRNAFRSAGNLWDGGSAALQGDWDGAKEAWNEQWSPITDLFTADGASNALESVTEKFTLSYYADQVDKAASAYGRGDAEQAGEIWGGAAFDLATTATVVTGGVSVAAKVVPAVGKSAVRDLGRMFNGSRQSRRGSFRWGAPGTKPSTLEPGPFAKESVPGHPGRPTALEQRQVNVRMAQNGCHTCGTKIPGTKSGNAIVDHQPPQALGTPTMFLPHCNHCKARQGGQVLQALRRGKRTQ